MTDYDRIRLLSNLSILSFAERLKRSLREISHKREPNYILGSKSPSPKEDLRIKNLNDCLDILMCNIYEQMNVHETDDLDFHENLISLLEQAYSEFNRVEKVIED